MYVNVNHHPPFLVSSDCLIINDPKYIQDKLIRQNQLFSFRATRTQAWLLYWTRTTEISPHAAIYAFVASMSAKVRVQMGVLTVQNLNWVKFHIWHVLGHLEDQSLFDNKNIAPIAKLIRGLHVSTSPLPRPNRLGSKTLARKSYLHF